MFTTLSRPRITTRIAAGLFAMTALALAPSPAQATRIPADPVAFVPTPVALAQMTIDAHAASVRAALQELRSDVGGSAG
jgi:hypothetical protein